MNYLKAIFLGSSEASLDFDIADNDSQIIQSTFKSKQICGLNAGEIILVDWLHNKPENSDYPQYYKYDYYIDPLKSTEKLIKEGFVRFSTPQDALSSLKVVDLKSILEKNNLSQSGRKKELIERIVENISVENFSAYIKSRSYVATDKGLEVINGHGHLINSHKSRRAQEDPANVILFLSSMGVGYSDAEIVTHISLKQFEGHCRDKNYGLMTTCMTRIGMAHEVGGDFRKVVSGHLAAFIISMSGWSNGGHLFGRKNIRGHKTRGIYTLEHSRDLIIGDLDNIFNGVWEAIIKFLPKHYFSKEKTRQILWSYIDGDQERVDELLGPEDKRSFLEALKDWRTDAEKLDSEQVYLDKKERIDTSAVDLCYPKEGLAKRVKDTHELQNIDVKKKERELQLANALVKGLFLLAAAVIVFALYIVFK